MQFASDLRAHIGIDQQSSASLDLAWWRCIDQDYVDIDDMDWDESGRIGVAKEFTWDIQIAPTTWESLSQHPVDKNKILYRSHLNLGQLTRDARQSIGTSHENDRTCFFAPDEVSLQANPVCPGQLDADERVCTGLIALSFSGPGYLSWGHSFADYAQQFRHANTITTARRACREFFPVKRNWRFKRIAKHLGEIFLNRDDYEEGDWILPVVEGGRNREIGRIKEQCDAALAASFRRNFGWSVRPTFVFISETH